jgi:ligand-binding SRPBCC domain-containing protein
VYRLERTQFVGRPIEKVFPFFAEPTNLARITPQWLNFRVVTQGDLTMREGLLIDYRVSPLLIPQRWTSCITLWDPPNRFVDEQLRGPYRRWHHLHEFREVTGGVEISDCVTYELPLGPLGRAAHALFVRRQLEAIFDYRERAVSRLFGE